MNGLLIYLIIGACFAAEARRRGVERKTNIPLWSYFVTVLVWPYTATLAFYYRFLK